jgi:hypothetical protein
MMICRRDYSGVCGTSKSTFHFVAFSPGALKDASLTRDVYRGSFAFGTS